MTRVFLVRHGHTEAAGQRLVGRLPNVHLDALGREEASRVGQSLSWTALDAVYSSPLEHAVETARAIAEPHGLELEVRDGLNEVNYGEWTGLRIHDLRPDDRFRRFNAQRGGNRAPGGEHGAEIQGRMVRELSELRDLHPEGNIAVVGHADPLRAALAHFSGIPLDLAHRLELGTGSLSLLELWPSDASLRYLNRPPGSPP